MVRKKTVGDDARTVNGKEEHDEKNKKINACKMDRVHLPNYGRAQVPSAPQGGAAGTSPVRAKRLSASGGLGAGGGRIAPPPPAPKSTTTNFMASSGAGGGPGTPSSPPSVSASFTSASASYREVKDDGSVNFIAPKGNAGARKLPSLGLGGATGGNGKVPPLQLPTN